MRTYLYQQRLKNKINEYKPLYLTLRLPEATEDELDKLKIKENETQEVKLSVIINGKQREIELLIYYMGKILKKFSPDVKHDLYESQKYI